MRRWVLLGLAALGVLALPSTASAAGGTYRVVECGSLNRAADDAIQRDSPEYAVKDYCDDASNGNSFAITNRLLAVDGKRGLVRFPTRSNALGIVGVSIDAKLRGDNGSHPRLWLADRNLVEVAHFATTDSPGTGYHHYTWTTTHPGAFQLVASLTCERDTCGRSDSARVLIRNVRLTVADYSDPVVEVGSSGLFRSGWLRGTRDTEFAPRMQARGRSCSRSPTTMRLGSISQSRAPRSMGPISRDDSFRVAIPWTPEAAGLRRPPRFMTARTMPRFVPMTMRATSPA